MLCGCVSWTPPPSRCPLSSPLPTHTYEGPVRAGDVEDAVFAWRVWAYARGMGGGGHRGFWAPGGGLLLLVWVWVACPLPFGMLGGSTASPCLQPIWAAGAPPTPYAG